MGAVNDNMTAPILIGGCDRSGTTLLASLIGAHSQCLALPETSFKQSVMAGCILNDGSIDANDFLKILMEHSVYLKRHWNVAPERLVTHENSLDFRKALDLMARLHGERSSKGQWRRWIDHTPANIMYARALLKHLPGTKMIHIVRDGRAVAASLLRRAGGPHMIADASAFWLGRIAFGFCAELQEEIASRILRIRYEDILFEPETQIRRIAGFLDLSFEPGMLSGGGFRPSVSTNHDLYLVNKPLDKTRIEAWRKSLSSREIEIFESQAGEILQTLGYQLDYGFLARPVNPAEGRILKIKGLLQGVMKRFPGR